MKIFTPLLLLLISIPAYAAEDLKLTLPPTIYAVPGVTLGIYHDNMVLSENSSAYNFEYKCKIGNIEPRRWVIKPTDEDVGSHPIEVLVKDASGRILEKAKSNLRISPRNSEVTKTLRILIVGDSLTHATVYPNELARLLSVPGNPKPIFLGTHKPASALMGVAHEGYGGWTWNNFLTKFDPETPGAPNPRKTKSPFLFPSADGKEGVFDLNRYFLQHCKNQPPDVVLFLLGINDCFGANPENPDAHIKKVLDIADKLLAAFHKAAPDAILGVGLTTPPNSRQSAFSDNYKDKYTRWGWKRIQHRLVQLMIERFSQREKDGIHLVPTELNLDPVDGYPINNGVHPNSIGYSQISASFYGWIKAKF